MFPAFLGSMMQGLMGNGAAGAVGNIANAVGNIDDTSKINTMPSTGGMMPNNPNGQNVVGGMPMVQANPGNDPLMSSSSLLNGIGGPLKQFFGFGG